MKFGKTLRLLVKEAPQEWQDKYLSYKDLKKSLNLIFPRDETFNKLKDEQNGCRKRRKIDSELTSGISEETENDSDSLSTSHECSSNGSNQVRCDASEGLGKRFTPRERGFIRMLQPQLEKFNDFFIEKEAENIIRQKELLDGIQKVRKILGPNGKFPCETKYKREMIKLLKDIVDFHGEVVLLVCYSIVNFTGLVKILKKYDKRTGGDLRVEYMQKVLEEPFFAVEPVFKIVKQCEILLQELFAEENMTEEIGSEEALYFGKDELSRRIQAARHGMLEMRKGSSTKSPFSLPPLHGFA